MLTFFPVVSFHFTVLHFNCIAHALVIFELPSFLMLVAVLDLNASLLGINRLVLPSTLVIFRITNVDD